MYKAEGSVSEDVKMITPIGVVAAELWLPGGLSFADAAVSEGRLRARQAVALGHHSVPAADLEAPPDMAIYAARAALKEAGVDAADLEVACHAWMHYQGHDLWSPAHYIAYELGAIHAFPVGIQQVCNGGSAAIEMAAARIIAPGTDGAARERLALITTADRFSDPGFDRWASDYGTAYGDGGTAVLLRAPARETDPLLLRSIATAAAPELESMHRGSDPFESAARSRRPKVDMRATKRAFLRQHGPGPFVRANERSIRQVLGHALRDVELEPHDHRLRYALLPRFGRKTLEDFWIPVLRESVSAELLEVGRDTGHLGAGDAPAGIADLLRGHLLAPGEMALVFSAGAGFTWSCLVLQAAAACQGPH